MLRLADGRRASMKEAAVRSVRRMWLSPTDMSDGRCDSGIGRGSSAFPRSPKPRYMDDTDCRLALAWRARALYNAKEGLFEEGGRRGRSA